MKVNIYVLFLAAALLSAACSKDSSVPGVDIDSEKSAVEKQESPEILFNSVRMESVQTKASSASRSVSRGDSASSFVSVSYEPIESLDTKVSVLTELSCFYLSITKGSDLVVDENLVYSYSSGKGAYTGNTPVYWPITDESYHFYAANSTMCSGGKVICDGSEDIVCAYLGSPIYKAGNSLSFAHAYARIGSVTVTAPPQFSAKLVSASITCPTSGMFDVRTGTWAPYPASVIELSSFNDNWVVPGDYTISITYDVTVSGTEYRNKVITGKVSIESGYVNNITAQIIGKDEDVTYRTPVLSIVYEDISASGMSASPVISYEQMVGVKMADGSTIGEILTGMIDNSAVFGNRVVSVSGSAVGGSGATMNTMMGTATTGSVSAPNLKTTVRERKKVFESSITCEINGVQGTASMDVYQQENKIEITSYGEAYEGAKTYGDPYWTDKEYYGEYTYGDKSYGDPIYGQKVNDGAEYGGDKSYDASYGRDRVYGSEYAGSTSYGSDYAGTKTTGTPSYESKNYGSEYAGTKEYGSDYKGTYKALKTTYGSYTYGDPYAYGSEYWDSDYKGKYEEVSTSYGSKKYGSAYTSSKTYGSDYEGTYKVNSTSVGSKTYGPIVYGEWQTGTDYEDGTSDESTSYGSWKWESKQYGTTRISNTGYTASISASPTSFGASSGTGTYSASGSHTQVTSKPWTQTGTRTYTTTYKQWYSRQDYRTKTQFWSRTVTTNYTQYYSRDWSQSTYKDWTRTVTTTYKQYYSRKKYQDYYYDWSRPVYTDYRQYYSRNWSQPYYKDYTQQVTTPYTQYYSRDWSIPYYKDWTQDYYKPWTQDIFQNWTQSLTTPWTRDQYQQWMRKQYRDWTCDVLMNRTDTYTSTATVTEAEKTGTNSGQTQTDSDGGTDKVGTDSGSDSSTNSGVDKVRTDSGEDFDETKSGKETTRTEKGTDADYRSETGSDTSTKSGTDVSRTATGTESDYRYEDDSKTTKEEGSTYDHRTCTQTDANYRYETGTDTDTESGTDKMSTDTGTDKDYRSQTGTSTETETGTDDLGTETKTVSKYRYETKSTSGTESSTQTGSDDSSTTVSDTPSVSSSVSWITIGSGSFTVASNSSSSSRSGTITATNNGASDSETISQEGKTDEFNVGVSFEILSGVGKNAIYRFKFINNGSSSTKVYWSGTMRAGNNDDLSQCPTQPISGSTTISAGGSYYFVGGIYLYWNGGINVDYGPTTAYGYNYNEGTL